MNAPKKLAMLLAAAAIALPQPALAKSGMMSKAWAGTWHLNTEQSKFSAPGMAVKSETRTYTVSGNRLTMKTSMVNADGKTMKWSYSAATDGKWYRMVGNPNSDHIMLTRVSDREIKALSRLKGKDRATTTAMVSADGKHITVHRSLLWAKGGPTDDTLVYDHMK